MAGAKAVALEPAGSSAMVETVVRHIDRMIGKGILKPGDSISEPALIADLGIGRVPVREAIRILAGEGLLELVPYRSARLRTVERAEILEMLDVLTGFSVIAIHLLSTKEPQDFDRFVASAEKIGESARNGASIAEILNEISLFHYRLIQASENKYLLALLKKTRIHYYLRHLGAILGRQAFLEAAPRYKKMATALQRGDGQAAIRILLRSVETSKLHAKLD